MSHWNCHGVTQRQGFLVFVFKNSSHIFYRVVSAVSVTRDGKDLLEYTVHLG